MNWEDECYLLSKRKFRENAVILNVFTPSKGKISGIVYGGNSRKIRNFLQISNKLFIVYNSKNENKIGYLKAELINPVSPQYFDNKEKTCALISLCTLMASLLPEYQPHKKIYTLFEKFLSNINLDNWIILYIFLEVNIIKELGFDTNLNIFQSGLNIKDSTTKVNIDGFSYEVPNFLILKEIPSKIDNLIIRKSLVFTRSIFLNKFYLPNNLIIPKSRVILENYFN
jgi:DNA repair protein RecO (recombination protein O)